MSSSDSESSLSRTGNGSIALVRAAGLIWSSELLHARSAGLEAEILKDNTAGVRQRIVIQQQQIILDSECCRVTDQTGSLSTLCHCLAKKADHTRAVMAGEQQTCTSSFKLLSVCVTATSAWVTDSWRQAQTGISEARLRVVSLRRWTLPNQKSGEAHVLIEVHTPIQERLWSAI